MNQIGSVTACLKCGQPSVWDAVSGTFVCFACSDPSDDAEDELTNVDIRDLVVDKPRTFDDREFFQSKYPKFIHAIRYSVWKLSDMAAASAKASKSTTKLPDDYMSSTLSSSEIVSIAVLIYKSCQMEAQVYSRLDAAPPFRNKPDDFELMEMASSLLGQLQSHVDAISNMALVHGVPNLDALGYVFGDGDIVKGRKFLPMLDLKLWRLKFLQIDCEVMREFSKSSARRADSTS